MAEQYLKRNEKGILVQTPTGLKLFSGMSKTWHEKVLKIQTQKRLLKVGVNHIFLSPEGWRNAKDLKVNDCLVDEKLNDEPIISIEELSGEFLFDFLDVENGSAYIADGVIHHNCEFLSSDALLISSLKLIQIQTHEPLYTDMGFKFWVDPEQIGGSGKTYMVSLDPATGNGSDFSAIEIFEFPSLAQVAEFSTNDLNIPLIYAKLKWILNKLSQPIGRGRAEVLWTFERNGVGEAIAALYLNDDKQPEHAELYSDHPTKMGVFTSGKSKIVSCLKLKSLVEKTNGGFILKSARLVDEMKNFVAKGGTYEAKSGATDDHVMSLVGIVRLLQRLSEYDERAYDTINEQVAPDADDQFGDEPVPFLV